MSRADDKTTAVRTIWDMGTLPFHMGPLEQPHLEGFPEDLPFRVGYSEALGLFTQVHDDATMETLHRVYAQGSQLGIPMGDRGLGRAYSNDFVGVICRWMGDSLPSSAVLEVGSGSGHLLRALRDAGANVFGVEPDPRCAEVMHDQGIPVATSEFEDYRADRSFDCIVHYCVLEHLAEPTRFLAAQKNLLAPGGRIICAVPDCTEPLKTGDISIFVHQHWSYFSETSLAALAAASGLHVEALQKAEVGGLIYVSLVVDGSAPAGDRADTAPEHFVELGKRAIRRFDEYVRTATDGGRSLGIYCPTRAFNYFAPDHPANKVARLFDDSPILRGKYVPPFAAPVENGDDLEHRPVDEVLIMSRSFGAAIESSIRARAIEPMPRIRHIGAVLTGD